MMTLLEVLRGTPFWPKTVTGSESVLDQCLDGFNGAVNRARARGRAAARRAGARAHHACAYACKDFMGFDEIDQEGVTKYGQKG